MCHVTLMQSEEQKEKEKRENKKREENLHALWNTINKRNKQTKTNLYIVGVPERDKR